jgi:hypothetical protein
MIGLCGMKFTPERTFIVGETLNIQLKAWAEFLTEPYKGSDADEGLTEDAKGRLDELAGHAALPRDGTG